MAALGRLQLHFPDFLKKADLHVLGSVGHKRVFFGPGVASLVSRYIDLDHLNHCSMPLYFIVQLLGSLGARTTIRLFPARRHGALGVGEAICFRRRVFWLPGC